MIRRVAILSLFAAAAVAVRAEALQVDTSFPYALHGWNTLGYTIAVGHSFVGDDFLGLEWTSFNPKPIAEYPGVGALRVDEKFEALQIAYRRRFPLFHFGSGKDRVPLSFYVGAGAGLGRVTASIPDSPAARAVFGGGLSVSNTELTGELLAGVEVDLGSLVGLRVGYRYIDSFNNVRQFSRDVNTDTKALEIGATFRF